MARSILSRHHCFVARQGKRSVVRADEKLTAFLELELAVGPCANCLDKLRNFLQTRHR
jgi:hypothetical protein